MEPSKCSHQKKTSTTIHVLPPSDFTFTSFFMLNVHSGKRKNILQVQSLNILISKNQLT